MDRTTSTGQQRKRAVLAGLFIGLGLMAAVDEIIFHQILGWHHFYDQSTPAIGLLSDGLLHAAELIALVYGVFLLFDVKQQAHFSRGYALSGGFLGAGGFQLFDGIINHKVLRLHQIRYDVPLLPYDLAWNSFAIVLIIFGLVLLRQKHKKRL